MKCFNFKVNWAFCMSMGSIVIAMMMLLYFAYMLLYPFKPAEFGNNPFPVEKKIIHQGERLSYMVEYHKLMNVPAKVSHMLINHAQINFAETSSFLPPGEYTIINNDVVIPDYAPVGKAHIAIVYVYRINALREITMQLRTEEFEIIPK